MNKIVKISSLGLVALLASCGKNEATTPLRKITPEEAVIVARSMVQNRDTERSKLFIKDKDEQKNELLDYYLFPFNATKISADIEINGLLDANMRNPDGSTSIKRYNATAIKKHIFFDLDNCFFHSHYEISVKTDGPEQVSYPVTDMYYFFIEDEVQPEGEDEPKTKYDKQGQIYQLMNFDNLVKINLGRGSHNAATQTRGRFMSNVCDYFVDDKSVIDTDGIIEGNCLDIDHILTTGLTSVTTNWDVMNNIYEEITGEGPFDTTEEILLMQDWLEEGYLDSTIVKFENLRNAMLDLEEEGTYFNYLFRSNDANSLGLETDIHQNLTMHYEGQEPTTETGFQSEVTSFTFKDLYLTDSHFASDSESETKLDETQESLGYMKLHVAGDQTINYNPTEKDTVPADWREYTPIAN